MSCCRRPKRPPPSDDSLPDLLEQCTSLKREMQTDMESVAKYRELVSAAEEQQSKAAAALSGRRKQVAALRKRLSDDSDYPPGHPAKLSAEQRVQVRDSLRDLNDAVESLAAIQPSTGSVFVRLLLGAVNTRAAHQKDRLRLRDEYNKFKDRTNVIFLLFPLAWALTQLYLRHHFRTTHWVYVITHIWLLYYYTSLALRENILRVNGSAIKPWWIFHHYVSAAGSVVVLTWPADSASWEHVLPSFTAYFFYQALVQIMQARYQKARHYQRVAMGKATAMDVSATETLTEAHQGLYLIVALVIGAQAWQVYQGVTLLLFLFTRLHVLDHAWYDFHEEVQCGAAGVLFIILGVLNFWYTVETLVEKAGAGANRRRIAAQVASASDLGLVPSGSAAAELNRLGGAASPALLRASPQPLPLRPGSGPAAAPAAAAAAAPAARTSAAASPEGGGDPGTPAASAPPVAVTGSNAAAAAPVAAFRATHLPLLPPSPASSSSHGGSLLSTHGGASQLLNHSEGSSLSSSSIRARKPQPAAAAAPAAAQAAPESSASPQHEE